MDLLKQFVHNWQKQFSISTNETVLLAVSGGADSMVMAYLFHKANMPFAIAHCNFQLRGIEADGDEELVKTWAAANKVPFHNIRFNTQQFAEEEKLSIQEAARKLRYEWLEEIRKTNGFAAIATAHHANDNAETLLINFFKGTGISGLHGILEKNGHVIRPLLFASRKDIETFAEANNIAYRNDSSNSSDKYLRNAVRNNILPVIANHFPSIISNLGDNIERFKQVEIVYKNAIKKQLDKLTEQRGADIYIPVLKFKKLQTKETVGYELFSSFGFSPLQVQHILELLDAPSGKYIESELYKIIKDRNFLIITKKDTHSTDTILIDNYPATIQTPEGKFVLSFSVDNVYPEDDNSAFIDLDKVQFPLLLRKWKTADYFYPLGMGMKKKKLARFFIDKKLPLHLKEKVWVLESQKKIIWVAGMRLDERFKITPSTKNILKLEITPA